VPNQHLKFLARIKLLGFAVGTTYRSSYEKGYVQSRARSNNGTVLNQRRRGQHKPDISPSTYNIPPGLRLYFITWLFSMIANIANCDRVSTYFSQMTGNHPTSMGLSMAKYIFRPTPNIGYHGVLWTRWGICASTVQSNPVT
jgi:hypothetical protein